MHFINLSGYLAASVQIKPVEPVELKKTEKNYYNSNFNWKISVTVTETLTEK